MSDKGLNKCGNHEGQFSQGVGGWAEYTVHMTETEDKARHDVKVPPGKVIPIIFLPGVMGSNLRMTRERQTELERPDNRAWRPDDISSADVLAGTGYGGWLKLASPAQRQLNFDPNHTEVEYYHYTEEQGRFDPSGALTRASDARHRNVPDDLAQIPPLMMRPRRAASASSPEAPAPRSAATVAQLARWRGWSEVFFDGAYGDMLRTAEHYMNNISTNGKLSLLWQATPRDPVSGKPMLAANSSPLSQLVRQAPSAFGASVGAALEDKELLGIARCWYPVHAMGYNYTKSNGVCAQVIAKRIRGLVKGYQGRGFRCKEVILVTHSMGGLLARALIHPSYGNLLHDADASVLGIYHNVMPAMGAAGAYKRMRFGFQEKSGLFAETEAKVFGVDGQHATAILANAPGPLELLPGQTYGSDWLKVIDGRGKVLMSWPSQATTALDSIYLQPNNSWWRLVNPDWVNPGRVDPRLGGGLRKVFKRLEKAAEFHRSIEKTFHPLTFASFCASSGRPSYGEVVFKVTASVGSEVDTSGNVVLWPAPDKWQPLGDDGKGTLTVRAGHRVLTLKLQPPTARGDETVPSLRSARQVNGFSFEHGQGDDDDYEHQDSYSARHVLASMLYSIVKIAKNADWS